MNTSITKNRTIIEILSITGIMALFFYANIQFGLLDLAMRELALLVPKMGGLVFPLITSFWVGLLYYSYYNRKQLKMAVRAQNYIEAKIEKQKLVNETTGLANRDGFSAVVHDTSLLQEFAYWAVLGIEIANIKSIKNVQGRGISKAVAATIARQITDIAKENEFIAHDEQSVFYLVITGEAEDEVAFRIDQIVETVQVCSENGIVVEGETYSVQYRFAAMRSDHNDQGVLEQDRDAIATRIDFALHRARKLARGTVVDFDSIMETAMRRSALIESSLQDAVNRTQIVPYFQPFIDMKDNRIIGFEVLARWLHPKLGIISPVDFIPVAEEQGLLGGMTISILRQACAASKSWPDDIILAFNISPTDLQDKKLINKLIEVLEETGTNPERVEIEITENAFVDQENDAKAGLAKLKEQGISISIDDFGTGYSSLTTLRMLSFDKIKIDQSFIKDIDTNPESRAIVENVIALGKSLGMRTTAEGIEYDDNRDLLANMGCTIGQGYLYAKPLPGDQVSDFLNKYDKSEDKAVIAA